MAYADLGRTYQILAQQDRMDATLCRAFAFRDHTGERATLDISSAYYQFVTNQPGEAIQVCQLWAQTFQPTPDSRVEYALLGHYGPIRGGISDRQWNWAPASPNSTPG
jgi:hypothetical protein